MNQIIKNYNETMSQYEQDGIEIILWRDDKPFLIWIRDTCADYIPKYNELDLDITHTWFEIFNKQDWDNIKAYSEIYFRLDCLISDKINAPFTITKIDENSVTIYHYSYQLGHRWDTIKINADITVLNDNPKPELKLFGKGSRYKVYEFVEHYHNNIFFMNGTKMIVTGNGLSAYDMDLPSSYTTLYEDSFGNNMVLFYDTRPPFLKRQYIKISRKLQNIKLQIRDRFEDDVDHGGAIPF